MGDCWFLPFLWYLPKWISDYSDRRFVRKVLNHSFAQFKVCANETETVTESRTLISRFVTSSLN